jgi:tungstate transport system ATP-binding protein
MQGTPLYRLQGIVHRPPGNGEKVGPEILRIDRLVIPCGHLSCVLGPSGAGKSTLLRLLALLEAPTEGRVTVAGAIGGEAVPGQIVLVFQRPRLLRASVAANLGYGLWARGEPKRERRAKVAAWLARLGPLCEPACSFPLRGRIAAHRLGRALIMDPKVLLLDEPTANLDPENVALIERG